MPPLRVAVVAPPFYEVPPVGYGGTELACHALVRGLAERDVEVTLVAAGESRSGARFVPTFPAAQPEGTEAETAVEVLHAARAAAAVAALDVDVVHDHTRAGPLTAGARRAPTVLTVHGPLAGPGSQAELVEAVARWVHPVALSEAHRGTAPGIPWAGVVHNGLVVEDYPFRETKDGFLLTLGRLSPDKGVDVAIAVARATGRWLVLAGGWTVPSEQAWFEQAVRPELAAGGVEWVGPVDAAAKKELLARASCLLFPPRWSEPFGMTLVEAMACGTPVVAIGYGAVPELVVDGETGIVCAAAEDLPGAVERAGSLDPARCRAHVAERFSHLRMAERYEAVYRAAIGARGTTQ